LDFGFSRCGQRGDEPIARRRIRAVEESTFLLAYFSAKGGHEQQRSRPTAIFTGTAATASGWSTMFLYGG
jgi:hypothetical protein